MLNKLVNRSRRRLARLRDRLRQAGSPSRVHDAAVDVLKRREIAGMVRLTKGSTTVRVELHVNEVPVAATWATPAKGERATSRRRRFRFELIDLWRFTKRTDRITIRIDNKPIPIAGKGMHYRPRKDGVESLAELRGLLAAGYVFGQDGRLRLSKKLDTEWQANVLGLYGRVNRVLQDVIGRQAFLCYGTLLGAVRDNGFIGHDIDFDCAYISRYRTGRAAAEELAEVAFELIDRGFNVVPKRTCLAVQDEPSAATKIDLYHLYRDAAGQLSFPFGIAGTPDPSPDHFAGVRIIELAGHDVLIPRDAERLVEVIYGPNWRTPNLGFRWQDERTTRAADGIVPFAQVDEVARANLAASQTDQPGHIRPLLTSDPALPDVVVEIGSSLGHDAVEIARAGKRVVGLERTRLSVQRAAQLVESHQLTAAVEFRTVEINDPQQLTTAIDTIRRDVGNGSLLFYARSFLRFSDRALRSLVEGLDKSGRAGDYLVADFRVAPKNTWPKDKSPTARPVWTEADLRDDLAHRPQWSVVSSKQSETSDDDHAGHRPSLVVARRG
jgi:hypothetical protein